VAKDETQQTELAEAEVVKAAPAAVVAEPVAAPAKEEKAPTSERIKALTTRADLTPTQINLLKQTVAKGASDDEFQLFTAICGRTGLDPFTRQIHFVKRYDAMLEREVGTIQTGIDGYRLIAQRTGEYDGQDPKQWCGEDGSWVDVWLKKEPPTAARATVHRRGIARPFVAVARFSAYVVTKKSGEPNRMWSRMGAEQLAKCAEALALRMAFPNELSDVYTHEEMQQAKDTEFEVLEDGDKKALAPGMGGLRERLGVSSAVEVGKK
jgi:phage recombination protein Bet